MNLSDIRIQGIDFLYIYFNAYTYSDTYNSQALVVVTFATRFLLINHL